MNIHGGGVYNCYQHDILYVCMYCVYKNRPNIERHHAEANKADEFYGHQTLRKFSCRHWIVRHSGVWIQSFREINWIVWIKLVNFGWVVPEN